MAGMSQTNYEFLDCGKGRRLERFGSWIIDRPAPQADFAPKLPLQEWEKADARYIRRDKTGDWEIRPSGPDQEKFTYSRDGIIMELRFSENGQLGIYPEQQPNWDWIREQVCRADRPIRVLNGFAYTGGSTLFTALGDVNKTDVDVYHLDASKSAINWARRNRDLSNLQDRTIRFVVEDILRFMEREIKRERAYQGIILDPPAFGRAPGGKTWALKKDLFTLMDLSRKLFRENPRFFLISCHDPSVTKSMLADQMAKIDGINRERIELLDLVIPSEKGNALPNGIAARWSTD